VDAAERRYEQALGLSPKDPSERSVLLSRHAEALAQRSRVPEARTSYDEAIAELQAAGNLSSMASAMVRQSFVLRRLGDGRFRALMTEAVSILERLGPSTELIEALTLDAAMSVPLGDLVRALESATRAIRVAASLGLPAPASAIGQRGTARAVLGDRGGLDDLTCALELATQEGLGQEVAILYNDLCEFLGYVEGPSAKVVKAREGVAFARARGIEDLALHISCNLLVGLVEEGSYDEAETFGAELIARLRNARDDYLLVFASGPRIRLLTRRGRRIDEVELEDWLTRALRIAPADILPELVATGAAARLSMGDREGALSLLAELEARGQPRLMPAYVANVPDMVRTALAAGNAQLAGRIADGLEPKYPTYEPVTLTARAMLAEDSRDPLPAVQMFTAAAELWGRYELPWERARALLGAGRCLSAVGRPAEAEERLLQAREIFVGLDAKPSLAETDELLGRVRASSV
jgi:tetratricopeptide (TPR) repeat protein